MSMIDPEQERKRLAEFYSRQFDGNLEKIAGEAYELSEIAQTVLQAELQRRGLNIELARYRPVRGKKRAEVVNPSAIETAIPTRAELPIQASENDGDDLVTIRQFRDLPQALLAKGCLESAGIECALTDDNMVRMDWFYSNAIGGIKLLVKPGDAADAEQLLNQPIPEHLDVSGVGDYEQPKCPNCGSLDINFRELDPATYLSLGGSYLGVFVPVPSIVARGLAIRAM
jgi:hypothetical protein